MRDLGKWIQKQPFKLKSNYVFGFLAIAGGVTLVVLLLRISSILQSFELSAFDAFIRLRPIEPKDDRIRIVRIEQQDINTYSFPLSDATVAELLQKIDAQKPAAIGLDMIRDRPVGEGSQELRQTIQKMPHFVGVEVLNENTNFYTPPLDVMWKPDLDGEMRRGVGFNNLVLDSDGVVRRNIMYWEHEGITRRSFALQLGWLYLEEEKNIFPVGFPEKDPKYLKFGSAIFFDLRDFYSFYGWLDPNQNYQILANMRSPKSFEQVTLSDVLKGNVPDDFFRDRIVLIGFTAENTKDLFFTPFGIEYKGESGRLAGIEIHANFVSEILSATLDGRPLLKTFSFWQDSVWIFLCAILGSVTILYWDISTKSGLLIAFFSIIIVGGFYILFSYGWIFPIIPSLISFIGSSFLSIIWVARSLLITQKTFKNNILGKTTINYPTKQINFKTNSLNRCLIKRYQITKILAVGGFGKTFIAEDKQCSDLCVVKQLKADFHNPNILLTARRLFESEAKVLQDLGHHDQIPSFRDYFELNQEFYLVQDYIQGYPLDHEIIVGRKYTESYTIALLNSTLEALNFVHKNNVIHRDIKPANLIRREQDGKIVLIDFGAVKEFISTQIIVQRNTQIGTIIGTPGYMPSEQARGKPRKSSDIYALGILILQALTGKSPPTGANTPNELVEDQNTMEILWRQDAPHVSPALAEIIDRMISYDFRERFQSALEVIQALEFCINSQTVEMLDSINMSLRSTDISKYASIQTYIQN